MDNSAPFYYGSCLIDHLFDVRKIRQKLPEGNKIRFQKTKNVSMCERTSLEFSDACMIKDIALPVNCFIAKALPKTLLFFLF